MNGQEDGGDGGGGEGGGGEVNNHPQLQPPSQLPPQNQLQPHPPPPPPQVCPRCDSVNTKFCYYNNYSLTQPRYFCKTCKRYWTHGGSLRNVPIGGGCRKGKRAKTSSSSSSSPTSLAQHQPPLQEVVPTQANPMSLTLPSQVAGRSSPAVVSSVSPYYQDGGYLSTLAAIHSLSPSPPFNQSLSNHVPSNLGFLQGFNASSLTSQRHVLPSQIFQTGIRNRNVESLYASDQSLIQTNEMGHRSYASLHDWSQNSLWSTVSTTSTIGDNSGSNNNNNNNNNYSIARTGSSSSPSTNQWPDLPGYGLPP